MYGLSAGCRVLAALLSVILLAAAVLVLAHFGLYPAIPLLAAAFALLVPALYRDEWIFNNKEKTLGSVLGWVVRNVVQVFSYDEIDVLEVSSFMDGKHELCTLALVLKKDGTRVDIADSRDRRKIEDLAHAIAAYTNLEFC